MNDIDEEIFNLVETENVENEALECIRFFEPFHNIMAKISLQLGNPLDWQGFWDQYQVSILNNETLSDIDRFNYLKKYLSGPAQVCISGLTLSSENYKEAIQLYEIGTVIRKFSFRFIWILY